MPDPVLGNLRGVAVISPDDVWAVGYTTGGPSAALTMHWDGSVWSVVPNGGGQFLHSVAGVNSDDVWAVGKEGYSTIALHWDGTAWARHDPPFLLNSNLFDVVALAPGDVWAVGAYASHNFTLVMHWDGTGWTQIPSPNVNIRNVLNSVAATGPNDIWAAGWWSDGIEPSEWLTLHWDGVAWSNVPMPAGRYQGPVSPGRVVHGITAVTPNEVWVAGQDFDEWYAKVTTAILRYDGTGWRFINSPNPDPNPSSINILRSIAMRPGNGSWAVGSAGPDTFHSSTTVLRAGPPCVTVTPSPPVTGTPTSTPTQTPPRPTATSCPPGTPVVLTGTISLSDPVQRGRVFRDGPPGTCEAPVICLPNDIQLRHYDSYTFTNTSGSAACIMVQLNADDCIEEFDIQGAAYLRYFDPASVCAYFLADTGMITESVKIFSFVVPSNLSFVIVVNELDPGAGCSAYTLTVTGLPAGPCVPGSPTTTASTATATATIVPTITDVPTTPTIAPTSPPSTPVITATDTATSIAIGTATITATATASLGDCQVQFSDVPEGSTFYPYVRCLACLGIVGGYPDNTFRPGAQVTRAQLAKIVANAAGYNEPHNGPIFEDVPEGSTFYLYVARLAARRILSGYPCGGSGEPCGLSNLPYFRPGGAATRGQMSKIAALSAGLTAPDVGQMFEDVPEGSTFYAYVQALASRGVINGYACGGAGEPCSPSNMPYFRPHSQLTRGQAAKISSNTFFPECAEHQP